MKDAHRRRGRRVRVDAENRAWTSTVAHHLPGVAPSAGESDPAWTVLIELVSAETDRAAVADGRARSAKRL
jgi:hypothetical protein